MQVFVTGATGFIGQHLCRHLVERGDRVWALVRNPERAARLPREVAIFKGDLQSLGDRDCRLPPVDVVIHLAGLIAAKRLEDYEAVNFAAVEILLECLGRQSWTPRRMLFASSLAAAGPSRRDVPHTEADPPAPIDPYGVAKARAEIVVRAAPFPTTSFRPPSVFGPGDPATFTLFKSARRGVGMRVVGAPQRLSFVDVRDLVTAIGRMADDRREGSYLYYACNEQAIDIPELWRELGHAVGRKVRVVPVPRFGLYLAMQTATLGAKIFGFTNQLDEKQYRQIVAPAFVCSSALIRHELGWQAQYDLGSTLSHAAEGYRKDGWFD